MCNQAKFSVTANDILVVYLDDFQQQKKKMSDTPLFNALSELIKVLTLNERNYAEMMEQLCFEIQDPKQLSLIRQLNEQFFLEQKTSPQAKKQISQVLTLLGTSQKVQGTDEFFAEKQSKNAQGIGISILDNHGSFILTDKQTRGILECIEHPIFNLVDFSCEAAKSQLINILNSSNNEDTYEKEFQMTIYSESIRRKAMKHLNSIGKKQLKSLQKIQVVDDSRRQQYSTEKQIQLKYLKTLDVKLRNIKLKVEAGFSLKVKQQNDILGGRLLDQLPQDQTVDCLICEMSVSQGFQNIDVNLLLQDQKIKIFEEKWKLQCEQFREAFVTGEKKKRAKVNRKQSSATEMFQSDFEDHYRLESNNPFR